MIDLALLFAILSALCFGTGMITSRIGLHHLDARSGAAISIPTATLLFVMTTPFTVDLSAFNLAATFIFAAVGLFYPAMVTLLTFRSNEELGPTITSAISGTAPLFAMLAAALLLGERVPPQAAIAGWAPASGPSTPLLTDTSSVRSALVCRLTLRLGNMQRNETIEFEHEH